MAYGNTGYSKVIGIVLYLFPNYYNIYLVGPVYYCPGHPYNIISSGTLKFYVGFKKVTYENLEHCEFFDPQGRS